MSDGVILMTVKELIRELCKMNPKAEVVAKVDSPERDERPLVKPSSKPNPKTSRKVIIVYSQ